MAALICAFLISGSISEAGWQITQLTHNNYYDAYPQINASGHIVWQGADGPDYEIFYWNETSIIKITSNEFADGSPQINEGNQIVWYGHDGTDYEI